jgi:hypothetical protein
MLFSNLGNYVSLVNVVTYFVMVLA